MIPILSRFRLGVYPSEIEKYAIFRLTVRYNYLESSGANFFLRYNIPADFQQSVNDRELRKVYRLLLREDIIQNEPLLKKEVNKFVIILILT